MHLLDLHQTKRTPAPLRARRLSLWDQRTGLDVDVENSCLIYVTFGAQQSEGLAQSVWKSSVFP